MEARLATHRLFHQGHIKSHPYPKGHLSIMESLEKLNTFSMCLDAIIPMYNFKLNFSIVIPPREDWENTKPHPSRQDMVWYTDGSKMETGTGSGIFSDCPRTNFSVSLGSHSSIFQAEVFAINECSRIICSSNTKNKTIFIFSDSQAALKALSSPVIRSKLVQETVMSLSELARKNTVILHWIPAHKGYDGNEKADILAKDGASKPFVGPEPFCGVNKSTFKHTAKNILLEESNKAWSNSSGQICSKLFLPEYTEKTSKFLLNLNRKTLKICTGLLTGHCSLKKHLHQMRLVADPICRLCLENEETSLHIITECPALFRLRKQILDYEIIPLDKLKLIHPQKIANFWFNSGAGELP